MKTWVEWKNNLARLARHRFAPYLLIALGATVFYAHTLNFEFVYDDIEQVVQNKNAAEPWNFGKLFSVTLVKGVFSYRPLTLWTFALNRQLNELLDWNPLETFGFHFFNLILHVGVSCLFFYGWRLIAPSSSLRTRAVAALLFAVLPIHVEAVTSVVGRAELLASAFGLLFLIGHWSGWSLGSTCLLYLAAMFGKESGITFLGVAVVSTFLIPSLRLESRFKKTVRLGAYVLTAYSWLAIRRWVFAAEINDWEHRKKLRLLETPTLGLPSWDRLLNAFQYQTEYWRRILFPSRLSSDSSFNQNPLVDSLTDSNVLIFLGLSLGLLALAWFARKRQPLYLFFWFFYFITFAATGNFFVPVSATVAERFAYTPSLAICGALALGLSALWRSKPVLGGSLLALLLGFYGAITAQRNLVWRNGESFYRAQVLDSPESAKAHYNYARWLLTQCREPEAVAELNRAVKIYPKYSEAILLLVETLAARPQPKPLAFAGDQGR